MNTALTVLTTGSILTGSICAGISSSKSFLKLNIQLTKFSPDKIFIYRIFNKLFRRIKGLIAPDILTWLYIVKLECFKRIIINITHNITSSSLYTDRQYPLTFNPSLVLQSIFRNMISKTVVLEEIFFHSKLSAHKEFMFICYALPYHNKVKTNL